MTQNRKKGRPTKFEPDSMQMEIMCKLYQLGHIDREVASAMGICEKTLNNWKAKYPEFLQSIKKHKEVSDQKVKESLYRRACGYEHPEEKIFLHEGKPVVVPTTKHYPPDTGAAVFWLKNRQRWKDKQEVEQNVTITPKFEYDYGETETESDGD